MISFSTGKLRQNTCFEQIRSLFSFSNGEKIVEKNRETNWCEII